MKLKKIIFLCLFLSTMLSAENPGRFKKGDRILFLGDSITHIGWFITDLQLYYASRHPDATLEFINCGTSGNTAGNAIERYSCDIMKEPFDTAVLMFGMNDARIRLYGMPNNRMTERKNAFLAYQNNMRTLIRKLQADGKKTVIMLCTPYDEYGTVSKQKAVTGFNEQGIAECVRIASALAKEFHLPVIDLYHPMTDLLKKNPTAGLLGDRMHPGMDGQLIMAALILKSTGETGHTASVEINADTLKYSCSGASVSRLTAKKSGLIFEYSPQVLPFLPGENFNVKQGRLFDLSGLLNRELIRITGLQKGNYRLNAGGIPAGIFSAAQLAEGIDLAKLNTPARKQAKFAVNAAFKRHETVQKIRRIRLGDRYSAKQNISTADAEACIAVVEKVLADRIAKGQNDYLVKELKQYKSDKRNESALQNLLAEQTAALYNLTKPQSYQIELCPAH